MATRLSPRVDALLTATPSFLTKPLHKKRGRNAARPGPPKPRIEPLVLWPHQRHAGSRILEPAELGGNDVDELSQFAAPKHISGGRQLVLCRAEKAGRSCESLD